MALQPLPIAIVGMGIRLPGGCNDATSYWDLLINKRDARKRIPSQRFNVDGFANEMHVREAYFLEQPIDHFDAAFFSMSPAEAERMDPQQRLLLEVVYEALENAGETKYQGKNVAVFASDFGLDWAHMQSKDVQETGGVYGFTGHDDFVLANRVSYEFDLRGPSMTVKTGCSSGLVALHLACDALQQGDCSAAIVGASNLFLTPDNFVALDAMGVLSPDGSSKTFDAQANGYARGEAVNALYIKPLADAIRDGNPVRAIIRGTSVNADGKTKGLFSPSPEAHAALIRRAYERAGIRKPAQTPVVECHGTGTATGDPLELKAVAQVLGSGPDGKSTYIGGVKPNIGHGEAAAGLSSVIKAVLSLEKGVIPPNIKFETPNPRIPFLEANLIVPKNAISWPLDQLRRISVNSFGLGGANAHVILDAVTQESEPSRLFGRRSNSWSDSPHENDALVSEWTEIINGTHTANDEQQADDNLRWHTIENPSIEKDSSHTIHGNGVHTSMSNGAKGSSNGTHLHESNGALNAKSGAPDEQSRQRLLVFSAHNEGALQNMITKYTEYWEQNSLQTSEFANFAHTLSVRRQTGIVRSACVSDGHRPLHPSKPVRSGKVKGLLFVFTGQGAQWSGMGKELLRDFVTFRDDIRTMDTWLAECPDAPSWRMEDLLLNSGAIDQAVYAQPICTAIQIALLNLLRRWEILPAAVVGHSSGEIAAAYAAGACSMKDAFLIAYHRGVAAAQLRRRGAMAAVGLGRSVVQELLVGSAQLACENSSASVTISGNYEDVEATLENIIQTEPGTFTRMLAVERAYHSDHMQDVSHLYEDLISSIEVRSGIFHTSFYSSVTGSRMDLMSSLCPAYWRSNMERPVLFASAVESALLDDKCSIALEIGPHATLSGPFRQACKDLGQEMGYISCLSRKVDATTTILEAVGQLYCQGLVPRWDELNPGVTMSDLPPYQWNRKSYWYENRLSYDHRSREYPDHELLGVRTGGGPEVMPIWRKLLDVDSSKLSWLRDHMVSGDIVYPAAGYVGMIGEAIRQLSKSTSFRISHLSIETAMILRLGRITEVITSLHPHERSTKHTLSMQYDFTITSYDGSAWITNCSGKVCQLRQPPRDIWTSNAETNKSISETDWYRASRAVGFEYGPAFQALSDISCAINSPSTVAQLRCDIVPLGSYSIHPIAIDQLLQACIIASSQGSTKNMNKLMLPFRIDELTVQDRDCQGASIRSVLTSQDASSIQANGQIQTDQGKVILQCSGMQFRILGMDSSFADLARDSATHKLQLLEWRPHVDFVDPNELIRCTQDLTSCLKLVEKLFILCAIETATHLEHLQPSKSHLRRSKEWIEDTVHRINNQGSAILQDTQYLFEMSSLERRALIQELLNSSEDTPVKDVALTMSRVYNNALDIYQGKTDVLSLLWADQALAGVYNFSNILEYSDYFQLLGHHKPGMRILEIGAGTGGFTSTILPTLSKPGLGSLCSIYHYTDVSSSFFKAARERFQAFPIVQYAQLDISRDPHAQGFQQNSYDLILAANCLHATPDLQQTLRNCRSLLRSDGRLILLELCSDSKWVNYVMGAFPDWFVGDSDGRPNEPYIKPAQWDPILRKAGFDGIEASILDQPPPYQIDAMIIARPTRPSYSYADPITFLVSNTDIMTESVRMIRAQFESTGYQVTLCSLSDLSSTSTHIISLLDLDSPTPFLQDSAEEDFDNFRRIFKDTNVHEKRILWLTGPAQVSTDNPYHAMILGFARTIRLELGVPFITLEFDHLRANPLDGDSIAKIFRRLTSCETFDYSTLECEYALVEGNVCIPRYMPCKLDDLTVTNLNSKPVIKDLHIARSGSLGSLYWGLHPQVDTLGDSEVEIEVKSAGLNSWDINRAMGTVKGNQNLGLECAGTIRRVGVTAASQFQPGSLVLCWSPGSLSTHVKVHADYCVEMPQNVSFYEAATLLTLNATMIHAFQDLCHLERGESVLIHAAADAGGCAAIQIARMLGAEVYVTAATNQEIELLENQYRVPRSRIYSSENDDFVSSILQTRSGGVDVVLITQSTEHTTESWKCLAEGGTIVNLDPSAHGSFDDAARNRNYCSFDIVALLQRKPSEARRLLRTVVDLYSNGTLKPVTPLARFSAQNVKEAFRHLHNGHRIGGACIDFPQDSSTLRADFYDGSTRVRGDRTYLLVGGLGGLGKVAAQWLAERGAGSLIFFSRSATTQASDDADFLHQIKALGCSVQVFDGDVADTATVRDLIAKVDMPIGGVMHLPIVVRDRMVVNMTFEDWKAPLSAKIDGAWVLHHALDKQPLDFFIILGSFYAARGNHGQANYASANTFLSGFVQYRQKLGLPATIIDLGALRDIGYIAGRPDLLNNMIRKGSTFLSQQDYVDSLELAIHSSHVPIDSLPTPTRSFINRAQFIFGDIEYPLDARAQVIANFNEQREKKPTSGSEEASATAEQEGNTLENFLQNARQNPALLSDDIAESTAFLTAQISEAVRPMLGIDDDDGLGPDVAPAELAVDSLMAIELQSWWRKTMGTPVSILELTSSTSIPELGKLAREKLLTMLKE